MRRVLVAVLGGALLALSAWTLGRELERIGFHALMVSLRAVPGQTLAIALAATALNYVVLTWHDLLAFAYAGVRLPARLISLASFVAYAVSNNVGFALVSGTTARYRFFSRWGVSPGDVSRIVLFYSTTFWMGLCILGGLGVVLAPPPGLRHVAPRAVTIGAGCAVLAVVAAYVMLCARRRAPIHLFGLTIPVPPLRMVPVQIGVSTADWLLASFVLFVLLPGPRPDFLTVAAAFVCAQVLGLMSNVPGGLGVFEGSMVLLLAPLVSPRALLPALALFRIVYYLLPLAVALAVLLVDESVQRRRTLSRWSRTCRVAAVWAAPRALAFFTFVAGAVLLASGATPSDSGRLARIARVMPLALIEVSHFAASLAGVLLLLLAQAIARGVDAAFYVAAAALAIGGAASLLKGGDYEEAIILTLVLLALTAGRRHFTRRARIFEDPASPGWLAAVGAVVAASTWLGFFAYRHVTYSSSLWWRFALTADAPRFLRATVAVMILTLTVGVRQLLRPVFRPPAPPDPESMVDVDRVIALQPHTTAYLAYLGDKAFVWNGDRSAFIMYAVHGRSCVALGDPVGSPGEARELLRRFLETARSLDLTPVFYEVAAGQLGEYAASGLAMAKIGEEARVPLAQFTLAGTRFKSLRAARNHVREERLAFRVAPRVDVPALLPELQEVSDEWLALKGASEKGFSLGFFNPEYLRRFPVALLERDGRIEAFANLWCGPGRVELSLDLMRHRIGAPNGVMDALIVNVMTWGREQGYHWFNLGMAPLSGMQGTPHGRPWSRVAQFVYGHGEAFYNFQGLRAYKDKFAPVWEPRFLVYPGTLALPRVLADVTALVAGGYRQIFLRGPRRAA